MIIFEYTLKYIDNNSQDFHKYIHLCNHQLWCRTFLSLCRIHCYPLTIYPCSQRKKGPDFYHHSSIWLILKLYIKPIIEYTFFITCFTMFNIIITWFIHVVICTSTSVLFLLSSIQLYESLFIHLSSERYLGCLLVLVLINKVDISFCIQTLCQCKFPAHMGNS